MNQLQKLQDYISDIAHGAPFDPVDAIRALAKIQTNDQGKSAPTTIPTADDAQQAELLTEEPRSKKRPKADLSN